MKNDACVVGVLAFGLLSAAGAMEQGTDDLSARIAQLSKQGTKTSEVIRLLGEPEAYVWGEKRFTRQNLPANFILDYPAKSVRVLIGRGEVVELRTEGDGPGFTWRGKLRLGSSLEEALNVLGPPSKTVTGEQLNFLPRVLYKDVDGRKGECYYSRPDQNIRLFFSGYKICGLYVTLDDNHGGGGGGDDFITVKPIASVKEFDDVRFKDMRNLNLAVKAGLPASLTFNHKTIWPAAMPPGVDPGRLLAEGMNPGLGVRKLHQGGLTGKGVRVAIIDQPLFQDHPEFVGKIAAYHDTGCESDSSMHGPAVASLLVGTQCGTAPGARLYYVAAPSWTGDSAYYARALDWILAQNEKAEAKIRVVSVSAAPSGRGSPFKKNTDMWDAACARAENAGVLVLDCTSNHGFIGPCYYDATDPEQVAKCKRGFPSRPGMPAGSDRVLVPCSPRTTAEEYIKGDCGYQYCGQGGLSWGIPYCAGVMALGWQVRPELTGSQMRELLLSSAYKTPEGATIIDPAAFIEAVKKYTSGGRPAKQHASR